MNKILITFLLLTFSIINLLAQENEFNRAVGLYNSAKTGEALSELRKVVDNYQFNDKTSPAKFFIAKILVEQAKYSQAEREINNFIISYSSSKYLNDFLYLKIKLFYDQLRFEGAFKTSVQLVENSLGPDDRNEYKSISQNIALNHLSINQIKNLSDEVKSRKLKSFLLLLLGKKYLINGDDLNALRSFNEIISSYASSEEYIEANTLSKGLATVTNYGDKGILIGVMLPLNDENGNSNLTGIEILEGIKYAISEYNSGRENKIGILVRDTRRSKENIRSIKEEFLINPAVRSVIGPIFSDEVRITLNEFENVDLTLISPTATDEDLTELGSNFFQANPPFSIRGRIFAQYLYYVENKKRMAILNAIDGYSPLLAANFKDEFEKLGGRIIVRETYRSNSFSLTEQIKNISSYSSELEGIYIPLSDKIDATAILSQLVQSDLNIPLYGNQDWMLVKGFETSPELSNRLTFTSDYYIDFNDDQFKNFTNDFQKITGRNVNRNVLYGYDTAKYLLNVMRNIDPTRKAIKLKMESGISSVGFKNNISFDESRMNKFLNIVRYNDGIFLLVDKFRAGR
jgi:branched-chain amino acid transport system substrate-binding protein